MCSAHARYSPTGDSQAGWWPARSEPPHCGIATGGERHKRARVGLWQGWRHLVEHMSLGDAQAAHPAIPGGPSAVMVDPASPLGAAPVAGVAAGGADPPGAGAMAAFSSHPLANMVRGRAGGRHLNRSDILEDVGRESALSALRPARGQGRAGARCAVAAKVRHTQGVAAVLGEMGRLGARRRDLAPARIAGRVRRATPHLLKGPLRTSVQARHRREGHAAPRLVVRGVTRDGVPAAG